jgi:hypothetical protein
MTQPSAPNEADDATPNGGGSRRTRQLALVGSGPHPAWGVALAALIVSTGCRGKLNDTSEQPGTEPTDTEVTDPQVGYGLTADIPAEVAAGAAFDLRVTVLSDAGDDVTSDAEIEVIVTPDTGVTIDGDAVTLTVAGTHDLSVTASYDGWTDSVSGTVEVTAGPPAIVDLILDPQIIEAGGVATASWTVTDSHGNPVDAAVTVTTAPVDGVILDGDQITGELVGLYDISATIDGEAASDTEELEVVAGAAVDLDLTLDAYDVEVGDSVLATVVALDAFGNVVDVEYTLEADPTAIVDGDEVTFEADAFYTVTATADALSDDELVTVDSNGPLIELDTPRRGSYLSSGAKTVRGTVTDLVTGVASVTLNGVPVTLEKDGTFTASVTASPGINGVDLIATDVDGNSSDLLARYMAGNYLADGLAMDDAIQARLTADALDQLGADAESAIDVADLEAGLIGASFGTSLGCWPFSDADFDITPTGMSYSALDVALTPLSGELEIEVVLSNLDVDLVGSAGGCVFGSTAFSGDMTASTAVFTTIVELTADGAGGVIATPVDTTVAFTNFDVNLGSAISVVEDVLGFFGLNIDDIVEGEVTNALVPQIEAFLPAAIEDQLGSIALSTTFDFGAPIDLDAVLDRIFIDPGGLTLQLEAQVTGGPIHPDIPVVGGSLVHTAPTPVYPASPNFHLGLNLDLMNRLLHATWEAGALNQVLTHDDIGLDPIFIGVLFPGATGLRLEILPQMPPVVDVGTGAAPLDLHLGEMQIDMYGDYGGVDTFLGTLSIHAVVELELELDGELVAMTPGDLVPAADWIDPAYDTVTQHENFEIAIEGLAPTLFPDLLTAIEIALPAVPGFTVNLSDLGVDGQWVVASGDLR